jgi:fumarylacetoacetase
MPYAIDETHDPKLESWVESANDPDTDFPIQNLPMCEFELIDPDEDEDDRPRLGIRVGDSIIDISALEEARLFDGAVEAESFYYWCIHNAARASLADRAGLRTRISSLLSTTNDALRSNKWLCSKAIIPVSRTAFVYPDSEIRDYTDFYASKFHATNVGSMFRPDNPLLPNYKWIPVGYHGRASSIVPSGTPIIRPSGQTIEGNMGPESVPSFGPCKLLDYELEMGAIIARGNELGTPVSMAEAEDHMLGLCILNDWSARDMQKWEYQPLGPFLAKNFASTVSPYIVTMEALAPFRTPAMDRTDGDPDPMPHLDSPANRESGGFDIKLEVFLSSQQMREKGLDPKRISRGNFKDMYWTVAQMIAHHTSNGCNLQPGDLLGSGTISGPTRESRGCLLELTWDGDPFANPPKIVPGTQRTPIELPTGESRKFLADGDEIIMRAYCERDGFRRIGFGECRGVIHPSHEAR